jgi:hypothetical protein
MNPHQSQNGNTAQENGNTAQALEIHDATPQKIEVVSADCGTGE